MSTRSRIGSFAAAIVITGALLLPASGVTAAPTAHKSGAIVNYLKTGKLKIAKRIISPLPVLGRLQRGLEAGREGPARPRLRHRAGIV